MRTVLAIAACSIRDLGRRPGPWLLLGLVVALSLGIPRWVGEGATLSNRLRFAAAYGIGFPAFLITAFVLVIAASAIARDVQSRRIQTVSTKPCAAWQFVLGKLVAIVGAAAALLAFVLGAFAVNAKTLRAGGSEVVLEEQTAAAGFFTPRVAVAPRSRPIDEGAVRRYVGQLREEGRHSSASARELEERARKSLRFLRAEPGGGATLLFDDVTPGDFASATAGRDVLVLRVEIQSSPVGGASHADCVFEIGPAGGATPVFVRHQRVPQGVPWTIAIPAAALPAAGPIAVTIRNPAAEEDERMLLLDPLRAELLLPYGSFWPGVFRAFGLILAQVALLGTVTLLASAVFSFPTANLLGFFVYGTGLAAGFLRDTFYRETVEHRHGALQWLSTALSRVGKSLLSAFPDLTEPDPIGRLTEARAISVETFLGESVLLILVQGGVVFLATVFLLSRRELARGGEA